MPETANTKANIVTRPGRRSGVLTYRWSKLTLVKILMKTSSSNKKHTT